MEAAHQKAETCFPGSCRAGVCHRPSHGATEKDCPGLQRSAPGSLQHGEGVSCRQLRCLHCPERCSEGGTRAGTKCIPATEERAGWCSTLSLLLVPAVTWLATNSQAPSLNRQKIRHSPSSDRKESSNTTQPDLCCWLLHRPVLTPTPSWLPGTPVSGRKRQRHSSVLRTCTVLLTMTDNTAFNRFRPSTPLTALTPRPVSPRDTSLTNCIIGHEEDITLKPINY